MAAKRTPLGHKRRGEALLGMMPAGGKDARGRTVTQDTRAQEQMARRIRNARAKYAKLHAGQEPPAVPPSRREAVTTQTSTGRRSFVRGLAATAQRNPTNGERGGWGRWP